MCRSYFSDQTHYNKKYSKYLSKKLTGIENRRIFVLSNAMKRADKKINKMAVYKNLTTEGKDINGEDTPVSTFLQIHKGMYAFTALYADKQVILHGEDWNTASKNANVIMHRSFYEKDGVHIYTLGEVRLEMYIEGEGENPYTGNLYNNYIKG